MTAAGGREQKRWRLARAATWLGLLLAAVVFWLAVGAAVVAWVR
jgi:hypothetical protein